MLDQVGGDDGAAFDDDVHYYLLSTPSWLRFFVHFEYIH